MRYLNVGISYQTDVFDGLKVRTFGLEAAIPEPLSTPDCFLELIRVTKNITTSCARDAGGISLRWQAAAHNQSLDCARFTPTPSSPPQQKSSSRAGNKQMAANTSRKRVTFKDFFTTSPQHDSNSSRDDDTAAVRDSGDAATIAAPTAAPLSTVLIVAGSSWAGLELGRTLHASGRATVLLFDQRPPLAVLRPGLRWCQGREEFDPQLLAEALEANALVETVVHLGVAAAGGCGAGLSGERARQRIVEVSSGSAWSRPWWCGRVERRGRFGVL